MAKPKTYAITFKATLGPVNDYGTINAEFEFERKLTGLESITAGKRELQLMEQECLQRLVTQIQLTYPELVEEERQREANRIAILPDLQADFKAAQKELEEIEEPVDPDPMNDEEEGS